MSAAAAQLSTYASTRLLDSETQHTITSKTIKSPYCRRSYEQAAAYEKLLQTMHLGIFLSLKEIVDVASMGPTFVHDELQNLTDPDYDSDCRLRILDFHTASREIYDLQNDSDREEVSHTPGLVRHFGSTNYSRYRQTKRRSCWLYRAQ